MNASINIHRNTYINASNKKDEISPVFIYTYLKNAYLKYFPTTGSDDAGKSLLNNTIM